MILIVDNKVVIITGASQGIGAGLVRGFRDRNYSVVATSRSIKPLNDPGIATIASDISSAEIGEQVVGEAVKQFGRVDSLINNAGIFIGKPFKDYTEADFANAIGINLGGFFRLTQAAMAQMTRQRSGHVVNITASLVDHPNTQIPAFLASLTKGGLNYATRALADRICFTRHSRERGRAGTCQDTDAPSRDSRGTCEISSTRPDGSG